MFDDIPLSVRYVKNGEGGRFWPKARACGQLHAGWWFVPRDLVRTLDLARIRGCIQKWYDSENKKPGVVTNDFNQFKLLTVENPSQHVWVTYEEGCLWWCTVRDGITINEDTDIQKNKGSFWPKNKGSFWLTSNRPWSNESIGRKLLDGPRLVHYSEMICEPRRSAEILQTIQDR
jgi:hypothetical protein